MIVLICGGRRYGLTLPEGDEWHKWRTHMQRSFLSCTLEFLRERRGITKVVSGAANGADTLAVHWATAFNIPFTEYPADWDRHLNRAGPIRNQQMLDEEKPNAVVAFPGNNGTADMIRRSKEQGFKVWEPVKEPTFHEGGENGVTTLMANRLLFATIKSVGGTAGSYGVFYTFSPKRYSSKGMEESNPCPDEVTIHGREDAIRIAKEGLENYVLRID